MNKRKFWTTVVAMFVVTFILEFIIHGLILTGLYYKNLPGLMIDESGSIRSFHWLFLSAIFIAEFLFAFFFTYIYTRGVEDKAWLGQGVRFGFLVWGVAMLPAYVSMYSWSRFPGRLLAWWIVMGLIECIILGIVCGALYRKEKAAA